MIVIAVKAQKQTREKATVWVEFLSPPSHAGKQIQLDPKSPEPKNGPAQGADFSLLTAVKAQFPHAVTWRDLAGTVPPRNLSLKYDIGYIKPEPFTSGYSTPDCFKDDDKPHKVQLDACHQAKETLHALLQCHSCKDPEEAKKSAEEDSGQSELDKTNQWRYECKNCASRLRRQGH